MDSDSLRFIMGGNIFMNDMEMKNQILDMVDKIGKSKVLQNKAVGNDDIGSTNIRKIANISRNADCYEELKLFINYKISKADGWSRKYDDSRTLGKVILDDMNKIYQATNKNDREAIRFISLYFGYLYWEKCVVDDSKGV